MEEERLCLVSLTKKRRGCDDVGVGYMGRNQREKAKKNKG